MADTVLNSSTLPVSKAANPYQGGISTAAPVQTPSAAYTNLQSQAQSVQSQIDQANQGVATDKAASSNPMNPSGVNTLAPGLLNSTVQNATQNTIPGLQSQLTNLQAQEKTQQTADDQAYQVQDQFYNLANQQQSAADQFRTNFPSIVDNQMSPERVAARQAIAQGVNQNKTNYNQRGLLYSGLRQGANADVTSNVNNQLNTAESGINQNLANEQQTLDQAPINTELAQSQLSGQQANQNNDYTNSILDALMNQSQSNNAAVSSLIGAGGQLAGKAAGGLINSGVTPNTNVLTGYTPNFNSAPAAQYGVGSPYGNAPMIAS